MNGYTTLNKTQVFVRKPMNKMFIKSSGSGGLKEEEWVFWEEKSK